MTDHYFSKDPTSKSNPINWEFKLRNYNFVFTTDYGVFSKKEVDFGSRLLVESFVEPSLKGELLDVGCGYGPIGLGLAKAFAHREVQMVDVNQRALELAKKNADKNKINNVTIFESNLFSSVNHNDFAAIVTNPPIRAGKQVVHTILEDSYHYLLPGGSLWVVIQKKQGAPSAKKKLEEIYEEVVVVKKDKGYFILKANK